MDDCNIENRAKIKGLEDVQIPLWTIVTPGSRPGLSLFGNVQIPLWTIVTRRDKGSNVGSSGFRFLYGRL